MTNEAKKKLFMYNANCEDSWEKIKIFFFVIILRFFPVTIEMREIVGFDFFLLYKFADRITNSFFLLFFN